MICDTPTKCNILECATICYASPKGNGICVGAAQTEVINEDKKKEIKTQAVNLHCICTENPTFTTVLCAVTCLSCLKTLEKE